MDIAFVRARLQEDLRIRRGHATPEEVQAVLEALCRMVDAAVTSPNRVVPDLSAGQYVPPQAWNKPSRLHSTPIEQVTPGGENL
ncbi:hypothetical protein EV562_111230 [Streptomyces sp. BK208]|uniref:hypothetical protein n=1 Tax=Streptomyces sp. BK208 TaxID=2512150 RepID=UPI00105FF9EC|nr:hypothetical protein [Streptomyces sp. BK208]TDT31623.1 hypothetical protein EV562_111230 [Streptomyces sp. BK208]